MNTREEIRQAYSEYQSGAMGRLAYAGNVVIAAFATSKTMGRRLKLRSRTVIAALTILGGLLLFAILGALLLPAYRQRELVRRLELYGAAVYYPSADNPSRRNTHIPKQVWNLMGRDFWEEPFAVGGPGGFVSLDDDSATTLSQLPSIGCIYLRTPLDENSIKRLRQLRHLSSIFLNGNVAADDVAKLSALSGITNLVIYPSIVTAKHGVELARLNKLRDLAIFESEIDPAVFQALSQLPALENLRLTGSSVSALGFATVGSLTQLKLLYADQTGANDESLKLIAKLSNLQDLWLNDSALTDESLVSFAKLSRLENLILENTSISQDGVEQLRRMLPQCRVIFRASGDR